MEQKITIKIAGIEYPLKVSSPEVEQLTRLAAETIDKSLTYFDAKFPNKTLSDKLLFVALNETRNRLLYKKQFESAKEEAASLQKELEAYLKTIE